MQRHGVVTVLSQRHKQLVRIFLPVYKVLNPDSRGAHGEVSGLLLRAAAGAAFDRIF